jgi:hypothetical protein
LLISFGRHYKADPSRRPHAALAREPQRGDAASVTSTSKNVGACYAGGKIFAASIGCHRRHGWSRNMKFPFDELHMNDPEHAEWVKSQRDPELWHVAAIALLTYLSDPRGFLLWLFDQPEVDRATAGYIFLGASGRKYLGGQTEFHGEGLFGRQWLRSMEAICRRAATVGFTNDVLGLHPDFEVERKACLDVVSRGMVADGIVVPHVILDAPYPPEQKLQYFIEDGTVLDYDPFPR